MARMSISIKATLICTFYFVYTAATQGQQEISFQEWKVQNSIESIKMLANGVLLIRLGTMQSSIDKLNEAGRTTEAEKIKTKMTEKNQAIMTAFKDEYDFTPCYFFFSQFSDAVKNGNLQDVEFFGSDGAPAKPEIESYLVGYFGTTQSDTAAFFNGYRKEVTESGVEFKSTYYGSSNMGISGLIIMSPQLVQLTDPFPYYVRTYDSLPIRRSTAKTVKKMNGKLRSYYNSVRYK